MKFSYLIPLLFIGSLYSHAQATTDERTTIDTLLTSWHQSAANANFDNYFDLLAENAVFIGTDATENWTKKEFKNYAKPHFDKGKAWSFTKIQRNIYLSQDKNTAWFDELLDTQMKICRGSGVLSRIKGQWKITHYVLSISIPNELSTQVIQLKTNIDNHLIIDLRN